MIGIIGAMESEVAQLTERMEQVQIVSGAGMKFYQGVLAGKEVVVVQCGVGKGHVLCADKSACGAECLLWRRLGYFSLSEQEGIGRKIWG